MSSSSSSSSSAAPASAGPWRGLLCASADAVSVAAPAPPPAWLPDDAAGDAGAAASPLESVSAILGPAQIRQLSAQLPRAVRGYGGRVWQRLFSLRRHGASLETLLNRAAGRRDTLLVVRDDRGAVFGAFAPEPWERVRGYFGSGDAWVFTFERRPRADVLRERILRADARRAELRAEEERRAAAEAADGGGAGAAGGAEGKEDAAGDAEAGTPPPAVGVAPPPPQRTAEARGPGSAPAAAAPAAAAPAAAAPAAATTEEPPRHLHVFRWSRRNKLYQFLALVPSAKQVRVAAGLGVGGGEHFALHLDDSLHRGCSGPCQTFLSPPLARGEDGEERDDAEDGAAAAGDPMKLDVNDLGRDTIFHALDVELFCFV